MDWILLVLVGLYSLFFFSYAVGGRHEIPKKVHVLALIVFVGAVAVLVKGEAWDEPSGWAVVMAGPAFVYQIYLELFGLRSKGVRGQSRSQRSEREKRRSKERV
jgi:hypothetical protein